MCNKIIYFLEKRFETKDRVKIHLIVVLDSHAQSINEYRQKNTLLEIFVLDELLDASLYGAQRAEATVPGAFQEPFDPRGLLPLFAVVRPLIAALQLAATGTIVNVGRQPLRAILQRDVTICYTYQIYVNHSYI